MQRRWCCARAGEQEVGSAGRKAFSTPNAQPIFVKRNLTPGQWGTEDKRPLESLNNLFQSVSVKFFSSMSNGKGDQDL